jgi:hypothetical protein
MQVRFNWLCTSVWSGNETSGFIQGGSFLCHLTRFRLGRKYQRLYLPSNDRYGSHSVNWAFEKLRKNTRDLDQNSYLPWRWRHETPVHNYQTTRRHTAEVDSQNRSCRANSLSNDQLLSRAILEHTSAFISCCSVSMSLCHVCVVLCPD